MLPLGLCLALRLSFDTAFRLLVETSLSLAKRSRRHDGTRGLERTVSDRRKPRRMVRTGARSSSVTGILGVRYVQIQRLRGADQIFGVFHDLIGIRFRLENRWLSTAVDKHEDGLHQVVRFQRRSGHII